MDFGFFVGLVDGALDARRSAAVSSARHRPHHSQDKSRQQSASVCCPVIWVHTDRQTRSFPPLRPLLV